MIQVFNCISFRLLQQQITTNSWPEIYIVILQFWRSSSKTGAGRLESKC